MQQRPFTLAVIYWLVIIVIAHFFAPPGYDWMQNTISELTSQGHDHKWIMQAGLMGFGALVILAVAVTSIRAKKMLYHLLPVALYGLAVSISGVFCAAPIDPAIPISAAEAEMHSNMATLAGFSLSLGIIWQIFLASDNREKAIHTIFLVAVMGFAIIFGLVENNAFGLGTGIVQRWLYLSGFAWLIYQEHVRIKKQANVIAEGIL